MAELFIYLLKVSFSTAVLYLVYLLLFRKDTFYLRNRVLLIMILLLPVIIPTIKFSVVNEIESTGTQIITADSFTAMKPAPDEITTVNAGSLNYGRLLVLCYWAVTALMLLRLFIQVLSTRKIIKEGILKQDKFPKIIVTQSNFPPFSFFPYAVIPSKIIQSGNYSDLLDHEYAHIRQGHTFDLLLCELIIAFQWFNPVVWLLKRSVILNNEYLADQASIRRNRSVKEYQYRLLNFQSEFKTPLLVHSFNRSIRDRLIMINKKPTPRSAVLKNILILPVVAGIMFACSTKLKSGTVINNPSYESSTVSYVRISKIELSESSTILHFHVRFTPGWWIEVPAGTYIQPHNSDKKMLVEKAEGIPLGEWHYMPESGEIDYKLIFAGMDEEVDKIDFAESNWIIRGIQLKPEQVSALMPEDLSGNWYNNPTGSCELSFMDEMALYNEQLWSYDIVDIKKRKGSIVLNNEGSKVTLYLQKKGKRLLAGESTENMVLYSKMIHLSPEAHLTDNSPFEVPVFQEDTTIYSGFFKGYNPDIIGTSFYLIFKSLISGNDFRYRIDISEDGSFSRKIPLLYPQSARIESNAYRESVYLEPGKKMFQIIDPGTNRTDYAGESAGINYDLDLLRDVNSFDYNEMRQSITGMSPEEYKSYCLENLEKDINSLKVLSEKFKISTKAYQMARMNMEYIYASHILDYDWYFRSAYKEQNKINTPVMEIPLEVEPLTTGYFDFLTDDLLNNPVAVYSENFNAFVHSMKNIALVQPAGDYIVPGGGYYLIGLINKLTIADYPFSEEEQLLVNTLSQVKTEEAISPDKQFYEDNMDQISKFFGRHSDMIRKFSEERQGVMNLFSNLFGYLVENGVVFSDEEKSLIDNYYTIENSKVPGNQRDFYNKWGNTIEKFSREYRETYGIKYYAAGALKRIDNFQKELGIGPCLTMDVILAQSFHETIYMETQHPISEMQDSSLLKYFLNQHISEYFSRFLDDRYFNVGTK